MFIRNTVVVVLFYCLLPLLVNAQNGSITGKIVDGKTGQPLPFASVYVNKTTLGTNANDRGEFALTKLSPGVYELVVSYIGHKPFQTRINLADSATISLVIRLEIVALQEVEIVAKRDDSWKKRLQKFERLFLGQGEAAKFCKITNPYVLTFAEDKGGTFRAKASNVIEVENMELGYQVSYELTHFEASKQLYLVAGYIRFQEMQTPDSVVLNRWEQNRLKAYRGSIPHFFRAIVENRVKEEGYELFEDRSGLTQVIRDVRFSANLDKTIFYYPLEGKVNTGKTPGVFNVQLPTRLEVHYKLGNEHSNIYGDIPYPISWIEVKGGYLDVDSDGLVVNPIKMTVSGKMFENRVSGLLPNDYKPEVQKDLYVEPTAKKRLSQLTYLAEKPYLHTDRSYFYQDEVIWFKSYLNYFTPVLADSLSRVLHVELVDKNNSVVQRRAYPINKGTATGGLVLDGRSPTGDYTLRAYTRWMLNFDRAFVFVKPIKILNPMELARSRPYIPRDTISGAIKLTTDKGSYNAREKVTVTINVFDELENITVSDLSMVVTDLQQAVPARNETSINTGFALPKVEFPDSLDKKTRFTIQKGFDIAGTFSLVRGKAMQGIVSFLQENQDVDFSTKTEKDGTFRMNDLVLYDTAKVSYVGQTLKGGYGKVVFDTIPFVSPTAAAQPLQVEIYNTSRIVHLPAPIDPKTILLQAVTIRDTRLEPKRRPVITADYSMSGEWLRERNSPDVLTALSSKVPVVHVLIINKNGFPKKTLTLSGSMSFNKNQDPLVVIDGVVVNDIVETPADMISSLHPNDVDRIEVSVYGGAAKYGARASNGVIEIFTRKGALPDVPSSLGNYDKSKLVPLETPGFAASPKFTSPDYANSEQQKDLPDKRATLYWNPDIKTDGKNPAVVTFYTADLPTQYRIEVEGVTREGTPVRIEKVITVQKGL